MSAALTKGCSVDSEADLTQSLGDSAYDAVVAIECLAEINDDDPRRFA